MEAVEASAPRPAAGALVPDRPGYRSFQLVRTECRIAFVLSCLRRRLVITLPAQRRWNGDVPHAACCLRHAVDRRCPAVRVQEGCEFLVAESADGKLDLRDVYVQRLASSDDSSEGSDGSDAAASGDAALGYRRPEGALDCLPAELRAYHAVEHYTQFTGDVFQEQEAKKWVSSGSSRHYFDPLGSMPFVRCLC